jgi:multisubunit Na+/H+ antiporter MnhG subunit
MPSSNPTWKLPVAIVALLVVLYAFEVSGNVLFGVFLAAVLYLVAWVVVRVSPGNPLDDMTRERRLATGGVVLAVLAYSVVIAGSILLGILVAAVVGLVAWLTSPVGPVARWLDRAT